VCLGLLVLALVTGCPGTDSMKNSVSGKVTLDGKPVAGTVVFVGADGKEVGVSPIGPDGNYTIPNPATGPVKVLVKSMTASLGGGAIRPPGGPTMPDPAGTSQGVQPPAKYGAEKTTPLTFEVKTGKQTYDIPLSP